MFYFNYIDALWSSTSKVSCQVKLTKCRNWTSTKRRSQIV